MKQMLASGVVVVKDGQCTDLYNPKVADDIKVIPLNDMPDGTCRTLKANYYKTGRINFQYHNVWGTTGAKVIYETE